MLDSTLKVVAVVVDSSSGGENAYGTRPGGLIPYHGDTTLFLDPVALSMLVIDPAGKIVRVMAAPRPSDAQFLVGGLFGNPGFDARGRLVYRAFNRPSFGGAFQPGVAPTMPSQPDTAALVRFDLATRRLDTVGFFKIPRPVVNVTRDANGGMRITTQINPLPLVDDWAVMSDGSVAIVRGRDYRVEFIGADGARTSADKIPHDWQRLSDEDKVAFVDSAKAAFERQRAAGGPGGVGGLGGRDGGATIVMNGGPPPVGAPAGGGQSITFQIGGGPGGPPPGAEARAAGAAAGVPSAPTFQPTFVNPSELPDYKPAFGQGSVRADADGRLWVRTIPTKPTPGGAVYDVIDRSGTLVDRVQVPAGTTIAGFGAGKVVILGMRNASGLHLQRIRM